MVNLREIIIAVATFLAISVTVSVLAGEAALSSGLIPGGLLSQGALLSGSAWLAVAAGALWLGFRTDRDFSTSFWLSLVALAVLLADFLPTWATRPFRPLSEALVGFQIVGAVNPLSFIVLTLAAIAAWWAVDIRLAGRGKSAPAVVSRMQIRAESLVKQYANISRVVVVGVASIMFVAANQAGQVTAAVTNLASNSPAVFGYTTTMVAGYIRFVVEHPLAAALSPEGFGVAAVLLFIVAMGTRYN